MDGRVEPIADAGKPIYGVSDADLGCELLVEATIRFTDGTTGVLSAKTARIRRQGDGGEKTTRKPINQNVVVVVDRRNSRKK